MTHRDMEITLSRGTSEATHFHPDLELIFVVEGQAEVCFGSERRVMGKEDVVLLNPSVSHSVSADPETILFHLRCSNRLLSELLGGKPAWFQCDSVGALSHPYGELRHLLREAVYQYVQQRKTDCLKLSSIYRVLDCLIENYQVETESTEHLTDDEKLRQIFQYINQNFQYGVSLKELSDQLYLSPSTLSRFFKQKTGIYFADYVSHIRMSHAVQELLSTDKGITAVAVDCGFSSASVFNRGFREIYGMTPTEYRTQKREAEQQREREEKAMAEQLREELRERLADQSLPVAGKRSLRVDTLIHQSWEKHWSDAVNAGSFDSMNQAQTQRQLLQLRERLNFRFVRLWSIFSPSMKLTSGRLGDALNYSRIDSVLDFLVEHELTPFVDFANRPDIAFGELDVAVFRHSDYIPFESQAAWENCLRELLYHLIDRYGASEVERWPFEFSYNLQFAPESNYYQGTFDYTSAFCSAWHIIKEELPNAMVGGPMGSIGYDKEFVLDFLRNTKALNCVPDFVSFMLFPYRTTKQEGAVHNTLSPSENVEREYLSAMEDILSASGCTKTRLFITEWNNTVSTRNFLNDSSFRGAYFVRTLPELSRRADLVIPWVATDLISSHYDVRGIANGGAGLLTRDGIPKPALFALQFLGALGDELVQIGENYILTTKKSGSFYLLCCNFKWYSAGYFLRRELVNQPEDVEQVFRDSERLELDFALEHLPESCCYLVKERSVSPQGGALLGEWKKFQYDTNLSPSNVRYISDACKPRMEVSRQRVENGSLHLNLVLQPHEIRLLHIQREAQPRSRTFSK